MNTCYVYLRVSTDEQAKEGFSLDNQKRACLEFARNKNYHVKEVFLEEGRSARTTDRPEFQRLLKAIEEKPTDTLVVYKIDRFARNVNDFTRIYNDLKNKDIRLLSVTEGDLMESNSLIPNIFASVAQWESEVNGQRTKAAMLQKFNNGWWPGWAPIGYMNVKRGDKRVVVPDPKVAPLVIEAFKLYSTGEYSFLELCREMFRKGLTGKSNDKMMSVSTMQHTLSNTFYYGLMKWGKPKQLEKMGKHKPLIKKALFDQCQFIAAKHRNFLVRERKYNYLLRGHTFCLIHNRRLTAEAHPVKSKKPKVVSYYHCTMPGGCKGTYLEAELLERRIANLFKRYEFNPEFIEMVRTKVKEYFESGRKNHNSERSGILNRRKAIEKKRNRLEDLLVDGTITRDVFKRQHAKFQVQIANLDEQLMELEEKHKIDVTLIDEVLALTRNIYQTYIDAPDYLKRHYLRFFFEGIYIKDKRIAKVVETPLFSTLRRQNKVIIRSNWLPG